MIVVDTSVWVEVLRDASKRSSVEGALASDEPYLTRFTELELLVGARDEHEWRRLEEALASQLYVELGAGTWAAAARIFFDLRRLGRTVRSPVDCCIAQLTLEHEALLLHRDRDFETISTVRPLQQRFLPL